MSAELSLHMLVSSAQALVFLLHGGPGGAWEHIMSLWAWDPGVLAGCALLLLGYVAIQRFRLSGSSVFFTLGVLVLLLALVSPLHILGEHYLFSAHMVQHLLLVLVVPPLLILGTPAWVFRRLLRWPLADRIERTLGQPAVAWSLAAVAVYVWHVPALFELTLHNMQAHIVEHGTFLVTGALFWWPVMCPLDERRRLNTLSSVLYLFSAGVTNCVLGIVLSFAQPGLYPTYLNPADPFGVLVHIRYEWGITTALDQQLGGMIMWVPGCLAYLGAILGTLGRWYSTPEAATESVGADLRVRPGRPVTGADTQVRPYISTPTEER
jgi:putative membrane protein